MTAVAAGARGTARDRETRSFERRAMGSPLRLTITGASHGDALLAWGRVSHEFECAEQAMSRFRETSDLTRLNRAAGAARTGVAGDPSAGARAGGARAAAGGATGARAGAGAVVVSSVEVDARLRKALAAAWRAHRLTGGRFDPRILTDLERLGYRGAPFDLAPDDGARVDPVRAGGSEATGWLVLDGRRSTVAIDAPVDLGGIGKGLALRWAWRRLWAGLDAAGDPGVLLEAGGDIIASGPAPGGGAWLVGIEDPSGGTPDAAAAVVDRAADVADGTGDDRDRSDPTAADVDSDAKRAAHPRLASHPATSAAGDPVAAVTVESGAVCTSSVAIHRWRGPDGLPAHHLVDPATGRPGGHGLLAVTVAGPDPAWAEVWSKTLFLEGARGIADAARRRGLAAWWIAEDGRLRMTPAARPRTAWTS